MVAMSLSLNGWQGNSSFWVANGKTRPCLYAYPLKSTTKTPCEQDIHSKYGLGRSKSQLLVLVIQKLFQQGVMYFRYAFVIQTFHSNILFVSHNQFFHPLLL